MDSRRISMEKPAERSRAGRLSQAFQNRSVHFKSIEDNEEIRECLKIFAENKITKKNAWSLNLIDSFSQLIDGHHRKLKNFQIVGSTLEASSKIYGLRVDAVHTECLRLASGLGHSDLKKDDEEDAIIEKVNEPVNEPGDVPKKKKKRMRKLNSTITRNKETLNAKLDTQPMKDPLFAMWSSICGDVSSSNRLIMNILQTNTSDLKLHLDDAFFDSSSLSSCEYNIAEVLKTKDDNWLELLSELPKNQVLRPQISGYKITDNISDDDEPRGSSDQAPGDAFMDDSNIIDYVFDINADIEDMPDYDNIEMQYGNDDLPDLDEMSKDDQIALKACSALRHIPSVLTEMRPDNNSIASEYAYRSTDNIKQFWAGPSHWKFRKTISMDSPKTVANRKSVAPKSTRKSKKKMVVPDFSNVFYDDGESMNYMHKDSVKASKLLVSMKTWNPDKLKLPTDLKVDNSLFERYDYGLTVPVRFRGAAKLSNNLTKQIEVDEPNFETDANSNYDNDDINIDMNSDINDEYLPGNVEAMETDHWIEETNLEIDNNFQGAPEAIPDVKIDFARRAKIIDMKQMKTCSLGLIRKDLSTSRNSHANASQTLSESYKPGLSTFHGVYNELPTKLTPAMAESLSPSVAFYTILHLCNENSFRLENLPKNVGSTSSFIIRDIYKATHN